MMLALLGLGIAAMLELLCIALQKYNKMVTVGLVALTVALLAMSSTAAMVYRPNVSLILVWVLSMYKVVNLVRLSVGRLQPAHLRRITLRTSLALSVMQSCLLICWVIIAATYYPDRKQWILITGILALTAVYFNTVISWRLYLKRSMTQAAPILKTTYPTVSVLIPARNETDELEASLDDWVRSDYPKLEIIVLDDCSQTSRTPEIIRQYAHAGVRFIPGKPVKRGWLAKNQAYQTLAAESTGQVLLFCGVDARPQTDSLRGLITDFYAQELQMASILPRNYLQAGNVSVIQLMRYARELIRSPWSEQPPVLSTAWLIEAHVFTALGGFAAVKRSVLPEAYFSRVLQAQKKYAFWVGAATHNVASQKQLEEQQQTAIRTLYPLFHKQPEVVAVASLVVAFVSLFPIIMLLAALFSEDWLLALISLISVTISLASYRLILEITYGEAKVRHVYSWPVAVFNWLKYVHLSLYKYEFSEVDWKGRNICMPVMDRVGGPTPLVQVRNKYRKR